MTSPAKRYLVASIGLMALTLVGQLAALIRTVQLAATFGAAHSLDAFYLGNNYTVGVFTVVSTAVTTVVIPEAYARRSLRSIRGFVRAIALGSLVVAVLLVGGIWGLRDYVPGASATGTLVPLLTTILMVGQLFRVPTALWSGVLQAHEKFLLPRVASLIPAFVPVAVLFMSTSLVDVCVWLAVSYALEALLNWLAIRREPRDGTPSGGSSSRALLLSTLPVMGSSALFQIQMIVLLTVVGQFGAGYITTYSNALQVVGFAQLLLIQNLVTLAYPRLSGWVRAGSDHTGPRVSSLLSALWALGVLIVVLYAVAGLDALRLLFEHGKYSADAISTTYWFGLLLIVTLPLSATRDILYRVLFSLGLSRRAATNSIMVVILNLGIVALSAQWLGVYSIFLGLGLGAIASAVAAWVVVRRSGYSVPGARFATGAGLYTLAGVMSVVGATALAKPLSPGLLHGVLAALLAGAIFALLSLSRVSGDLRLILGRSSLPSDSGHGWRQGINAFRAR